mmetsp:Transcript_20/g.48  ORF Transcript_20/g.48 Transcript_20/m.48 type:complete len:89 (-) Transcript_20:716-982(-)
MALLCKANHLLYEGQQSGTFTTSHTAVGAPCSARLRIAPYRNKGLAPVRAGASDNMPRVVGRSLYQRGGVSGFTPPPPPSCLPSPPYL